MYKISWWKRVFYFLGVSGEDGGGGFLDDGMLELSGYSIGEVW